MPISIQVIPRIVNFICDWLPVGWRHGNRGRLNHQSWHIATIFEGEVEYIIDGDIINLYPGQYLIIPPKIHYQASKISRDVYAMTARFAPNEELIRSSYITGNFDNFSFVKNASERMEKSRGSEELVALALMEVLHRLFSKSENIEENSIDFAVQKIREKRGIDCNIKDLARTSNYSYRQFIRLFKDYTGTTPIDFILDQKIRHACALLNKGKRVKEVANELGYKDSFYFCKQFKEMKGISPGKWAKMNI